VDRQLPARHMEPLVLTICDMSLSQHRRKSSPLTRFPHSRFLLTNNVSGLKDVNEGGQTSCIDGAVVLSQPCSRQAGRQKCRIQVCGSDSEILNGSVHRVRSMIPSSSVASPRHNHGFKARRASQPGLTPKSPWDAS
jgi:hypothetical protein